MMNTTSNQTGFFRRLLLVCVAATAFACSDSSDGGGTGSSADNVFGQSGFGNASAGSGAPIAGDGSSGIGALSDSGNSAFGSSGAGGAVSTAGAGGSGNAGMSQGGSSAIQPDSGAGGQDSGPAQQDSGAVPQDANVAQPDAGVAADRVDNPYAGAKGYVNPEWRAKANAEPGGDRIANTPTAVWIDRIAAIEGTPNSQSNGPMGVRDHLDEALAQAAGYIQFVIYNLPGRDCSALASNGELGTDDLPRYKSEYIDPIVAIMADPKYRALRIINIIEIDSLPNLITNQNVAKCAQMQANGGYVQGVTYALQQLGALSNTYNYVDAAHHGWLGWDSNFGPAAELFAEVGRAAGMNTVHGFITNTANYSVLVEPYFNIDTTINGVSVRQSRWVDWNYYVDELSFAQAFREKLISLGFDSAIGMLIDTSRNGWGGPDRPTAASSATDVDTFVDQSRIDRRIHAGNWCNQSGAGLGERPVASPAPGIDAYVWIKPPGESDGSSSEIPNDDGKGFDQMCDPSYGGNERNGNSATGALPNAPISGAWFSAQFQELMRNAYPPL
jgi:cellulose 1,4-beta-cellobiosidase